MPPIPIDRVIQTRPGGVSVAGQQMAFSASSSVSAMLSGAGIGIGGMQNMGQSMGQSMYGGAVAPAPMGTNIGGLRALNAYQLQELQKLGVRML